MGASATSHVWRHWAQAIIFLLNDLSNNLSSVFLSIAVQFWISPAVNGQQRWITYMDKDNLAPQRKR